MVTVKFVAHKMANNFHVLLYIFSKMRERLGKSIKYIK